MDVSLVYTCRDRRDSYITTFMVNSNQTGPYTRYQHLPTYTLSPEYPHEEIWGYFGDIFQTVVKHCIMVVG